MSGEVYKDTDYAEAYQITFESLTDDKQNKSTIGHGSQTALKYEETVEGSRFAGVDFSSLPYLDDSNIPVCICLKTGKVIYRNLSAKKYLPELRRGSFIRKYVSELSFSLYNSLCDNPGRAECIYIDGAGSVFRNSVTACVEYSGEIYTVWMFFRVLQSPGVIGSNTALPEYLCRLAKRIVADKREMIFSDNVTSRHPKRVRFSDREIYDGFFDQYIPGMSIPIPAYHIVDTVSRLLRKYTRELGMRINVKNNILGDRFKVIDDYIAFADNCLRIFTLFAEIAQNRSIDVDFLDGEDSIRMLITFWHTNCDTSSENECSIIECFGESSVRFALDLLCVEHMTESLGWTTAVKHNALTTECIVSIPVLRGDSFGILRSPETEEENISFALSELERYIAFIAENFTYESKSEKEG